MRTLVARDVVVEGAEDEAGISLMQPCASFTSWFCWFDQKVNERFGYRRRALLIAVTQLVRATGRND